MFLNLIRRKYQTSPNSDTFYKTKTVFSSKITHNERRERLQDCSKLKETKKKLQLKEIHDHGLDTASGKIGIIKDITELTGLKSEYELAGCR